MERLIEVGEIVWAVGVDRGGGIVKAMARVEKMGGGPVGCALVMTEEDKAVWWPMDQLHLKWDGERPRRDSLESRQRAARTRDLAAIEGANRSLWEREKSRVAE